MNLASQGISMNDELRKTIETVIDRWQNMTAEKNLPALLEMITDDAVFVGSKTLPLVGRKAIADHHKLYFEKFDICDVVDNPHPAMELMGDNVVVWTADCTVLMPLDGTQSINLNRRTMTVKTCRRARMRGITSTLGKIGRMDCRIYLQVIPSVLTYIPSFPPLNY